MTAMTQGTERGELGFFFAIIAYSHYLWLHEIVQCYFKVDLQ